MLSDLMYLSRSIWIFSVAFRLENIKLMFGFVAKNVKQELCACFSRLDENILQIFFNIDYFLIFTIR